jgi:group I intron endonuclease
MTQQVGGIYGIRSVSHPERIYIGSARNIRQRKSTHLWDLRKGRHSNDKLQHHYNKYGEGDLVFEPIVKCDVEDLIRAEQVFINLFNPWFNICVTAGSNLGMRRTAEARKKMSQAKLGNKINLGRLLSEEHKQKLSNAHKGKVLSEDHRQKISHSLKGRIKSMETRRRMSEAHKAMAAVPPSRLGVKYTEEQKRVIQKRRAKTIAGKKTKTNKANEAGY